MKPLALDLCCGLGGWSHGLIAEGWDVVGFDIERHEYGGDKYPGQLVIQDIRTIDGRKFRGRVSLITASPPCTEFSYMAMPWKRGKQIAAALRGNGSFPDGYKGSRAIAELTELFDACVRIGREAGCPVIIENVRGEEKWVGRARWSFGSYYLWGDVPALMPITQSRRMKSKISCSPRNFSDRVASTPEEAHALHYKLPDGVKAGDRNKAASEGGHKWTASFAENLDGLKLPGNKSARRWDEREVQRLCDAPTGFKTQGMNWSDRSIKGQDFTRIAGQQAEETKGPEGGWFNDNKRKGNGEPTGYLSRSGSKSNARKAASAIIAKIPLVLARHIAKVYLPKKVFDSSPET